MAQHFHQSCERFLSHVGTPNHPFINGFSIIINYKPSVLGYPHLWKPSCEERPNSFTNAGGEFSAIQVIQGALQGIKSSHIRCAIGKLMPDVVIHRALLKA